MHRYFEINEGGHNIRCKLYYSDLKTIRRIIIFCHGFGGHKDNGAAEKFAERLTSKYKGAAMVTFNWPCHGDDVKKKLTLSDCFSYLSLVVEHVKQRYQTEQLYCYATSFGGWVTLNYILENGSPFRKIAMRCPALNMYDALTGTIMTQDNREQLMKGKEVPVGFDRKVPVSPAFLAEIREKDILQVDFLDYAEDLLIIHGTTDEIIAYEVSYAFADNNLIEFVPVEGADHRFRDPKKMEVAMKAILEFFHL